MSDLDPKSFPLGVPVNRPADRTPAPVPMLGRPGWWQRPGGEPFYVEPAKPPEPIL
jgi:hypothetical protein